MKRALLEELGPVRIIDHALGTREIAVPIPAIGVLRALTKLIRPAARRDVALPHIRGLDHDRHRPKARR